MAKKMAGRTLSESTESTSTEESDEDDNLEFRTFEVHGKEVEVSLNSFFLPECKLRFYAVWLMTWK